MNPANVRGGQTVVRVLLRPDGMVRVVTGGVCPMGDRWGVVIDWERRIRPGITRWHADLRTACAAAVASVRRRRSKTKPEIVEAWLAAIADAEKTHFSKSLTTFAK